MKQSSGSRWVVGSACLFGTLVLCTGASHAQLRVKDDDASPALARASADGSHTDMPDAVREQSTSAKSSRVKSSSGRRSERAKAQQPKRRGKRSRRAREPTAEYQRLRDKWHEAIVEPEEVEESPAPANRAPLVISPVNGGGTLVSVTPQREDGGFTEEDLDLVARAFAPQGMKSTHAVSPHLVDLVYRTMRHFNAPLVHLVSGYRADRAGSRHTQGRAIDMVIPGVSSDELAAYVRMFGFCGVGIYPKSGFVHLDVRDSSYFWVDNSLPNERSRGEPILGQQCAEVDREARARGEAPDTFVPGNEREDRAAKRSYARRAKRRHAAAQRAAARAAAAD